MKLIIQDARIVAEATDDYTGPMDWLDASDGYEPGSFLLPGQEPLTPSIPPRAVTYWAFRKRFTHAERVGLELAALDDATALPEQRQLAASVRVYLADAAAAAWIDLDDVDARTGVQALETAELLAGGRSLEILDAPVALAERPPGA